MRGLPAIAVASLMNFPEREPTSAKDAADVRLDSTFRAEVEAALEDQGDQADPRTFP